MFLKKPYKYCIILILTHGSRSFQTPEGQPEGWICELETHSPDVGNSQSRSRKLTALCPFISLATAKHRPFLQ